MGTPWRGMSAGGAAGQAARPSPHRSSCPVTGIFRVVKLAHAGCADPHIIETGPAAMRAVAGEPERRNTAGEPGEQASTLAAAGYPARGGWHEGGAAGAQAGSGW
jgi:hypothetical protein